MLERNFDMVCVGKSYLSLLFGLELLELKQKVLTLDDDRLSFGNIYDIGITDTILNFLKGWGEERSIDSLINIENYLSSGPLQYIIDGKRLRIGQGPSYTIKEFLRVAFDTFTEYEVKVLSKAIEMDDFDNQAYDFFKRLGSNGYRFRSFQNYDKEFILGQANPFLKEVFTILISKFSFKEFEEKSFWPKLSMASSFFYFKKLNLSFGTYEILQMIANLMGKQYRLNQLELEKSLLETFVARGGSFKKTFIREWKFYDRRPWSLELASYDGIVHPQKIALLGGNFNAPPLKIENHSECCQSVNIKIEFNDLLFKSIVNENFVFLKGESIATDTPIIFWRISSESSVEMSVLYRKYKGTKIEFVKSDIEKIALQALSEVLSVDFNCISSKEFTLGSEIYIDISMNKKKSELPSFRKISLIDNEHPLKKKKLKNVYYFGPYKEGPLGILSSLLEVKSIYQFI